MNDHLDSEKSEQLSKLILRHGKIRRNIIWLGPVIVWCIATLVFRMEHQYTARAIKHLPPGTTQIDLLMQAAHWSSTIVFGLTMLWFTSVLILQMTPSRRQRRAVKELLNSSDVHSIPGLMEAFNTQFKDPRIKVALANLLPKLRREDANMLSKMQLRMLATLPSAAISGPLRKAYRDYELYIACVKALSEIGNEKSIIPLERIADSDPKFEEGVEIKKEAQKALDKLRPLINEELRGGTLVRAAKSVSSNTSLLKPVTGSTQGSGESLVRPVVSESLPVLQPEPAIQSEQPAIQEQLNTI